jgi:c-di-GMP-binding flagellar brake protein YcgR
MSEQPGEERREKVRVDYKTRIDLYVGDKEHRFEGSSRDMSLNGLFVYTEEHIPLETKCTVSIFLSGKTEGNVFEIEGKVVRMDPFGVAIEFDNMDLVSYTYLKNIVRYNTDDPDNVH